MPDELEIMNSPRRELRANKLILAYFDFELAKNPERHLFSGYSWEAVYSNQAAIFAMHNSFVRFAFVSPRHY